MVRVEGVRIDNPVAVWHEIKNAREVLGDEGKGWNSSGWYNLRDNTMCLANVLRFVGLGERENPRSYGNMGTVSEKLDAENLVRHLVAKKYGRSSIPHFNDSRVLTNFDRGPEKAFKKGFKQVAEILDEAAKIVKPHAFAHTVTVANEVMSVKERKKIEKAVAKDRVEQAAKWWKKFDPRKNKEDQEEIKRRVAQLEKESNDPLVVEFRQWLDSFDERGWDSFFDELADCNDEDCKQIRLLVGVQ